MTEFTKLAWDDKLDKTKNYIIEHKSRPSSKSTDINIKKMGMWIVAQQSIYNKKAEIMKKVEFYDKWTKFNKDNNLILVGDDWYSMFDKLKLYIDNNKKTPLKSDKSIKKLADWFSRQKLIIIENFQK
jgi:hypothetical protein